MIFNNTGGVLQAINGAINIGNTSFTEKINTEILGGDFIAKSLVVHSGDGVVNMLVNDATAISCR